MFHTPTDPRTDTSPTSPVLFSHPTAQADVRDVSDADLRRARQIRFSATTATSAAPRR